MDNPLVSVVLPTYNGERYLAQSIESVLAQTYAHWELIIVDDCSTDATPDIIAQYAARDDRIHPVRHAENKKLPGGLNTGFKRARGEFFTWTSDDNSYHPDALARLVAALQSHPDVGLVYADMNHIDAEGKLTDVSGRPPPEHLHFKSVVGACFLYRRTVHEQVGGYDETAFLAEDYDFWLRASAFCTFLHLPDVLYDYRFHEGALTSRRRRVLAARAKVVARALDHLPWTTNRIRGEAYYFLGVYAYQEGERVKAARFWLRAARYLPLETLRGVVRVILKGYA